MRIAVLGAGAWGTALASALSQDHHVTLWGRETELINATQQNRINTQFLPDITLSPQLHFEADIHQLLGASSPWDLLILATPVSALRSMTQALAAARVQAPIVWLCKGVEPDTLRLPHQVVADVLGREHPVGALSGPSFAQEVAQGLPCALVLASQHPAMNLDWVRALSSTKIRVYHSTDLVGVEVGGAHKNVLAIAAGVTDGLGLGLNARAAILSRGLVEMRRIAIALGGSAETVHGLSGIGDLILTATGNLSRNRRVGLALAAGQTVAEITAELGHVAEGVLCAHAMLALAQQHQLEAPITTAVCDLLDGVAPQTVIAQLMSRSATTEFI